MLQGFDHILDWALHPGVTWLTRGTLDSLDWAKTAGPKARQLAGFSGNSRFPVPHNHAAATDRRDGIRQLRNEERMADEDDLVESTKFHCPPQYAYVLVAIDSTTVSSRNSVS
jgi:hypothetical protein